MRQFLLVFTVLMLTYSPALAGSIIIDLGSGVSETIITNVDQEEKFQTLTDTENTASGTALSKEQHAKNLIIAVFKRYIQSGATLQSKAACINYAAASGVVKSQIDVALGGFSPCP